MKDVNERFLSVYDYLLKEKYVNNASDMASKIGISSSMMNEILKKRSNAGLKVIQKSVMCFGFINTEWLLTGVGNMLNTNSNNHYSNNVQSNIVSEGSMVYQSNTEEVEQLKQRIEDLEKIIETQKLLIDVLNKN